MSTKMKQVADDAIALGEKMNAKIIRLRAELDAAKRELADLKRMQKAWVDQSVDLAAMTERAVKAEAALGRQE